MAIDHICKVELCSGCGMCIQLCKHSAIKMISDIEGFLRPVVEPALCVDCGLCQKRCPANSPAFVNRNEPLKVFSGWSSDEEIRMASSSGGAFSEIAKYVISKNGVVFGVALDDKVQARHTYVEQEEDLCKLQGSKYVQSVIGNSYKEAEEFLRKGRLVLFSGTPCQIAGLYSYLHNDYENLLTIDLICHGVPSPLVFEDYKKWIEDKIHEKVSYVKFRCKKSSWIFFSMGINSHTEKNKITTYSYIGSYYADPYIRAFLRDNILRPSCYSCQYASTKRVADFTIADWWGYKATCPDDKDFERKGVSLLMCNSRKALEIVHELNMDLRERTLEEAIRTNRSLKQPFSLPSTRDRFWRDYERLTFPEMIDKWMYPERIALSTYIRIYFPDNKIVFLVVNLYERVMRKLRLSQLIVKIQAK